jgi:hypothetical protein
VRVYLEEKKQMLKLLQERTIFETSLQYIQVHTETDLIIEHTGTAEDEQARLEVWKATSALQPILTTMQTSYADSPTDYALVYDLFRGVPIRHLCNGGRKCPDILATWYTMAVRIPEDTSTCLVVKLRLFRDAVRTLQGDACYPYIRGRLETDVRAAMEEMTTELSMVYPRLEDTDLHEIITLLSIPDGLQSILHECLIQDTPVRSEDYMLMIVGISLLFLVGIVVFYRFQRRG